MPAQPRPAPAAAAAAAAARRQSRRLGRRAAASGDQAGAALQPPTPPAVPLLGHMPLMVWLIAAERLNVEDILLRWTREHGRFVEWKLPGAFPVVAVSDPEAIRQAFEVFNYPKSPLYKDLLPVLGEHSMVITAGEEWRRQREAFNPGFSSTFLRAALPGFADCGERLVAELGRAAQAGEVVLMHELAILTTLEVICQVGFGERVRLLGGDGIRHPLWVSFEALGRHVAFFLDNVPLNRLKLLPWNQAKSKRLEAELDAQLLAILRRRLAAMGMRAGGSSAAAASGSSACPFHAAAPEASQEAAAGGAQQQGPPEEGAAGAAAGQAQGVGGARDILSLAVELSAQGGAVDEQMLLSQVAWAVWYLCCHPEAEAKLVAELRAVQQAQGGDTGSGDISAGAFSWQQLQQCRYLGAVVKETLRVRPPVGLVARHAPPGARLAGYDVGGKIVLVSPYVLHRGPEWGPDAEAWRPERWLEEGGLGAAAGQPYCYMPFSRGPRNCIGEQFALLEAKTILSMLYTAFEFEYAGEAPEEVMMSVTAHPRFGVPLRVRRRPPAAAGEAAAAAGEAVAC